MIENNQSEGDKTRNIVLPMIVLGITASMLIIGTVVLNRESESIPSGPTTQPAPGEVHAERSHPVQISIHPDQVRQIGGISQLDRKIYFGLADAGTAFDERCRSQERYDWLIRENGITFGRSMQVVNGLDKYYQAVREDPQRPGFVDTNHLAAKLATRVRESSERFNKDMGGRLDVATHGHRNQFPDFMGVYQTETAAKQPDSQKLPKNIQAAAEFAATALRLRYTDFDRPAFYEPINEPHWSYPRDHHMAAWHTRARKVVRQQIPDIQVGGPCLATAYFYRNQCGAFEGMKSFINNTRCELDFYSFHVYDFLREQDGKFRGRVTSGLPLESVLDLIQNHTMIVHGKEVGIVVTEHGGYGATELVDRLAKEHFDETGFDWVMKKRSIEDFNMVSSVIANTLVFMDHPHTVRKAVPFILLNGLGWKPDYWATLYVPRDFDPQSDEWVPTKKIMFYRLLRDLNGRRVVSHCPDPDLQIRAFVDEATLFVVLNNLSDTTKPFALNLPKPSRMLLRRFGRNSDFTPYLTEKSLNSVQGLELKPRETILLKAIYASAIKPSGTVNETVHYGDRIGTSLGAAGEEFTVKVPDPGKLQYANLRVGISRPPDAGKQVSISFNGQSYEAPVESSADRLVELEYATCKIIPLDPEHVKPENLVKVSFPDGKPGAVGAVVIRAGLVDDGKRKD